MHLHRRHRHFLPAAPALAALLLWSVSGTASSQTSADLSLVSEYAGRGVALHTRPAPQLRIEHEAGDGWYGGVFASPVTLAGRGQGQFSAYGGRAQRRDSTLSWDAGVIRHSFGRDGNWNYHEVYAGLALGRASARLFYSPSYYGEGRSLYLDLGGAYPLGDALRLTGHLGLLRPFGNYGAEAEAKTSADLRIALVAEVGDVTLQAGCQTRWRTYLPAFPRPRAFSASASLHF